MLKALESLNQLGQNLTYHRDRLNVLSKNVAHLETPGYRAQDLRADFGSHLAAAKTTHARHLQPNATNQGLVVTEDDGAPRVDGNSVRLEVQMAKMHENKLRYSATTSMATRRLALLRYATSEGHS